MKLVDNIYVTEDVTLFSLCDAPADIAHMAEVFKLIADAGINGFIADKAKPENGIGDLLEYLQD
jgi:hypothetical protein